MTSKVLVVDDSTMVREQVKRALGNVEFTVVEARDGLEALEKLEEHGDVALVVCDVNMPRMGGFDFLERLRSEEKWKKLSVVMLTTEANPDLVSRARALNANGWIIKPFKPDLLAAAARKLSVRRAA
jgi:two-component system, chemotaxis family, chemotaxis protein CheY